MSLSVQFILTWDLSPFLPPLTILNTSPRMRRSASACFQMKRHSEYASRVNEIRVNSISWHSTYKMSRQLVLWFSINEPSSSIVEGRMWLTGVLTFLCTGILSRGLASVKVAVCVWLMRDLLSIFGLVVTNFYRSSLPLICLFVILLLHFAQRLSDHPLPRSLPESKINDLAQRTDYQSFFNDVFRKVLRVREPGTKGHHEVKMVRETTVNPSVILVILVNK